MITFQPMVARTEKQAFADRLNKACDRAGIAPAGRRSALANTFEVSRESVRKWLTGESIPETKRIGLLAAHLGVSGEWLLTGLGPISAAVAEAPASYGYSAGTPQQFDELAAIFVSLTRSDQMRLVDIAKVLAHDYTSPPKRTEKASKNNVTGLPFSRQGASKR